jgi:glycosyltransferase involved in cell wall biosynthesis
LFQEYQYGRLIALLIASNMVLWFYTFYIKSKQETIRIQIDKLIRNLGASDLKERGGFYEKIKPIMIVIPAYNEATNLKKLLPRIPGHIKGVAVGVLVVDDGSEDETKKVVSEQGHLVVSNLINRGQGAASRLGYDVLKKYHASIGVTMDADNQHCPEDIEKVAVPIIDGTYDLVIGSRVLGDHKRISRLRSFGIALLSRLINLMTGLRITDCSSGFKAFDIQKLNELDLTEDQFQSSEILIEACKKGLRVGEVPISMNRRKYGLSKKGTDWSYGLHFVKTIIRTWWR